MSDLRTDRDVEQTLSAWMDHVAPTRPPTRLLEGTFAETMRTRQVRSFPWPMTVWSRPLGRTATLSRAVMLLVVLGLLLALVAAVGLIVGGKRLVVPAVPSPAPTLSPSASSSGSSALPAAIPVTPEDAITVQGVQDIVTSGQAIWVMAPGKLDRSHGPDGLTARDDVLHALDGDRVIGRDRIAAGSADEPDDDALGLTSAPGREAAPRAACHPR